MTGRDFDGIVITFVRCWPSWLAVVVNNAYATPFFTTTVIILDGFTFTCAAFLRKGSQEERRKSALTSIQAIMLLIISVQSIKHWTICQ